jgi:hypothetical protein
MAGTGFGLGWGAVVIGKTSLNQKGPQMGPGLKRERHANSLTMVGVGMGEAWRAHESPQKDYVIIVLIRQVESYSSKMLCKSYV